MHHLQVDLCAVELRIRLLHHVDGRSEVEHPVKILAAVLRPVVPHALIGTIAHLLHIFEDGGVLVKADAQLPLIAIADRAELSAAALPCARAFHNEDGCSVLRCCTRRRQACKSCADDDNIRTVRIADFFRRDLRCCSKPCGRRRCSFRCLGRDEVIVGIRGAARQQCRRSDESSQRKCAPFEKVSAAQFRVLFHTICSLLWEYYKAAQK